jgi:hypothetical protein
MTNLRLYNGRVPIATGDAKHPIELVDFPEWGTFEKLYAHLSADGRARDFEMLSARIKGSTLEESAKIGGVTRERARQIEARFLRLMRKQWASAKPSI